VLCLLVVLVISFWHVRAHPVLLARCSLLALLVAFRAGMACASPPPSR
jgi:hypothetical protein